MDYLTLKTLMMLEQIADGSSVTQRFSTMPSSIREGGKAFKTSEGDILASRINREDVSSTLKQVYNLLDKSGFIDIDSVQPLGSTYYLSKPSLGDLDILVKPARPFDSTQEFKNVIYDWIYVEGLPIRDLSEKGRDFLFDEFSFLFPIIDQNNQLTGKKVQVDLILAENDTIYKWRFHWYLAPKDSEWKGAARNVLIGLIAKAKGYSWTKNGLYQMKTTQDAWSYETSELITNDVLEAIEYVFGIQETSVVDNVTRSVETMFQWLEHEGAEIKNQVIPKFNELVAQYEADGREMKSGT